MSKWRAIILKKFVNLKRGYDLPTHKTKEGDYPVVASTNIREYHNEYKVEAPVITVGRSGSIGQVQFINDKAWPLNTTMYVTDFKGNNSYFIYYFLQTMQLDQFNSGAGVPTLNRNHINLLKIKVPDIETQEKIVNVLSTYDKLIENNNRRIEILEQSAEEIYKEWFERMRFPGYEDTSINKGIPEGWGVKRVKTLGNVVTGKTPSTKIPENYGQEVMFIKTPDMDGNVFTSKTETYLSKLGSNSQQHKLLPKDSILVSCIGTGGVVSINMFSSHTNQQINSIVLEDLQTREWAFFTLKYMKETIELFGATGATMTNLSKGKFEKLKLLYPSNEIMKKFNIEVKPIFEQIKRIILTNENLKTQRDLLLPRLMNGSIEVK